MKLNLKNPIVFFDLETTGTNINSDRIVEICYLKVYPNGNEETKTMRINPEMHIPEEASAVPMAARVSQKVGQEYNPRNYLLMHAMGPNVAGVIGSAVAAGILINMFG